MLSGPRCGRCEERPPCDPSGCDGCTHAELCEGCERPKEFKIEAWQLLTFEQQALASDVVTTGFELLRAEEAVAAATVRLHEARTSLSMAKVQHKAAMLAARAGGVEIDMGKE